jgi:hypothetical protein
VNLFISLLICIWPLCRTTPTQNVTNAVKTVSSTFESFRQAEIVDSIKWATKERQDLIISNMSEIHDIISESTKYGTDAWKSGSTPLQVYSQLNHVDNQLIKLDGEISAAPINVKTLLVRVREQWFVVRSAFPPPLDEHPIVNKVK